MRNGGGLGQGPAHRVEPGLRRGATASSGRGTGRNLDLCLDLGRRPGFTWLLEPPTCARALMAFTELCATDSDWKSGAGICFCSLMPEGTGSRFYTGTGAAFGAAQRQTLHNARKGYLRVLYPYHPYYGQTFEVFGANGGLRDLVYIRMPNNTTRGIP